MTMPFDECDNGGVAGSPLIHGIRAIPLAVCAEANIGHEDWRLALQRADHARAVLDIVLLAVSRIPRADLRRLPVQLTPRQLNSRDDVEHWARRMDSPAALEQPARSLLRQILEAALLRLDEIGPARRRRGA